MILTTSDVAEAAMQNAMKANAPRGEGGPNRAQIDTESGKPGLEVIGPKGTQAYIHSLRHFMRRDKFQLRIREGIFLDEKESDVKSKKRKRDNDDPVQLGFYVETISLLQENGTSEREILSFVFTTPPIQGKFLPQKAKELGIPPGPLYAKLKAGQTVTVVVDGIEKTIESHEVLTEGSPGVGVAVIYCPSHSVLVQLQESEQLAKLKDVYAAPMLDVMVHVTPSVIFKNASYQEWIRTFPRRVDHIWVNSMENIGDSTAIPQGGTAYRSAALGALTRSLIHSEIYPSPMDQFENIGDDSIKDTVDDVSIINATRMLGYSLIPRARKGLVCVGINMTQVELNEAQSIASASGATEKATEILKSMDDPNKTHEGVLMFTGTGSAIPCKHRNVSGIALQVQNGNLMLLDVGEGTIGQLLRASPRNKDHAGMLKKIQAVWISHPHADHHLGLLRLLSEQNAIPGCSPLILMAPPSLFRFLEEYRVVDNSIRNRYIKVDCRDMVAPNILPPAVLTMMNARLGITGCFAVPVAHCAYSFAVTLDGTPFGRLSYSGDCRPSTQFAEQAIDTDLLIHEATFEDGMEDEAVLKRHSTAGEALEVGKKMRAKAVVLTHFSQRYPKLPHLKQSDETQHVPIVFAFDFMRITPATLTIAAQLTPALRLLYPEDEANPDGTPIGEEEGETSAKTILSVPGLFAQKELL
jgi:ribonuclease Z